MKIGPKYKICKRLGAAIFEKCQTKRFQDMVENAPRPTKRPSRKSDFGLQLIEKQKARFTYGMAERQFSRYAKEAMEGANPAVTLLSRLESRLDNVVYRAGFAPTRRAARQMVSHGHIMFNGRRMNVPSHIVTPGSVVAVRTQSRDSAMIAVRAEKIAETKVPNWMTVTENGLTASIVSHPTIGTGEVLFNPAVIIQFYSR